MKNENFKHEKVRANNRIRGDGYDTKLIKSCESLFCCWKTLRKCRENINVNHSVPFSINKQSENETPSMH